MTVKTKAKREYTADDMALVLDRVSDFLDENSTIGDRVKAAEGLLGNFKGFDPAKLQEAVDKLVAEREAREKAIANSKHGGWFPGVEDTHKKFSLLRAVRAHKAGKWDGAEYEKEVIEATREAVTRGSINVGDDNIAGFMVPDQTLPDVVDSILRRSRLVNLTGEPGDGQTIVSVYDGLVGGTVTINKFEGGLVSYWLGEEDKIVESIVNSEDLKMEPHRLGCLVRITDAAMKFASPRLEASIRRDMVRSMAKKLDVTGFYGNGGAHSPRGILKHPGIKHYRAENSTAYATAALAVASGSFTGKIVTYDDLMNMSGVLEDDDIDQDDSTRIISHGTFFRRLKQLKVDNYSGQAGVNAPYLSMLPMMSDAKLAEIIGPFLKSNNIASAVKAGATIGATATSTGTDLKHGDIVLGNWAEMAFGRWAGIEISSDGGVGVGFANGRTYMRATMYCDFQVRQERAFIACTDGKFRA